MEFEEHPAIASGRETVTHPFEHGVLGAFNVDLDEVHAVHAALAEDVVHPGGMDGERRRGRRSVPAARPAAIGRATT